MGKQKKLNKNKGFTLVEVAIVLIIGGLIISFAAASLKRYIETSQVKATKEKLDVISSALQQFVSINGKYPCPANRVAAVDTATFGVEIDGINCSTVGVTGAVPNNDSFDVNGTGGRVVKIGAVPVRSLGLPDDYINDSWGNRFSYAVTAILAQRANYDQSLGSISINDSNPLTPPFLDDAHYVVVSHGPNGAGAVTSSGGGTLPCTALPAVENGNCDNADATFVNTTLAGDLFDDYVKYRVRTLDGEVPAGAVMAFDLPGGCPIGWSSYDAAQGRVIRGANVGAGFPLYDVATTVPAGGVGPGVTGTGLAGAQQHALNYSDAALPNEVAIQISTVTLDLANVAAAFPGIDTVIQPTAAGATPHENLPPVINLWYCRKD